MKYVVTINNNSYEVEVEKGEARIVKTDDVAAVPVVAKSISAVHDEPAKNTEAVTSAAPLAGGDRISAPMPGTILQINKSAGEPVKKGEIIFILEAMKMENEILAPKDGVISQITAVKGATVNTGDILAVMQ